MFNRTFSMYSPMPVFWTKKIQKSFFCVNLLVRLIPEEAKLIKEKVQKINQQKKNQKIKQT